tara:strand:- start:11284 stop:11595 length:312 start_codon:yes stop_codon:yes gene_type:complete
VTIPFTSLGMLKDINVAVSVELGASSMRLREICALGEGQVIMLDRLIDEPLDLLVNGKVVARGEVVAEGNRFGLRIIELVGGDAEDALTATPAAAAAGPQGGL